MLNVFFSMPHSSMYDSVLMLIRNHALYTFILSFYQFQELDTEVSFCVFFSVIESYCLKILEVYIKMAY